MSDEDKKLRKATLNASRTKEQSRAALRRKVRIFYDLQRLRLQTAGRTYERATDIELHEADIAILDARAKNLSSAEAEALRDVAAHLKTMPEYTKILGDKEKFRGIGPTLAGVILSEVDIHRADTPSALWRYAGLAPVACRRCGACQDPVVEHSAINEQQYFKHEFKRQEKCEYKDPIPLDATYESARAERATKGVKLPFNRFLKTKLVGVAADCLIKANSPWRKFYDDYKHRLASEVPPRGRNDGHRHRMACRYMIKMMLLEIWTRWRELEGLEVRVPYQEQYLGHKHAV